MPNTTRIDLKALALALAVFGLFVGLVQFALSAERSRLEETLRAHAAATLVTLVSRIEAELNASVFLANGLSAFIDTSARLTDADLHKALASLYRHGRHIRNIGLAPQNTITHVYPRSGNEAAIGLHYPSVPDQWPAVQRAIVHRATVLAGPLELRQGGTGLISRTPVFLADETYWGLLSLVLDAESLFAAAGLKARVAGLRIAARGTDGLGMKGATFVGDGAIFDHDAEMMMLDVPGGSWQLAALPEQGWHGGQGHLTVVWLAAVLASGLLGLAVYVFQIGRRRVADSARRMRLFMETTLDGVILADDRGRIVEFNPAAERLFGYARDEMIGASLNRLMPGEDAVQHDRFLARANIERSHPMAGSREVEGVHSSGRQFPIEVTVAASTINGERIHMGVVRDISQRKAAERQLLAMATTDSLTGALTRREFIKLAEAALRRANRYLHPMSLLMIDIDHFKRINDTHGHPVGDRVIIDAVHHLTAGLRNTDHLGRFGGEEFIVLLCETDMDRAVEVAQRLLKSLRDADTVKDGATTVRYTASIGIVSKGPNDVELEQLINAADKALYHAKSAGRDRCWTAT